MARDSGEDEGHNHILENTFFPLGGEGYTSKRENVKRRAKRCGRLVKGFNE